MPDEAIAFNALDAVFVEAPPPPKVKGVRGRDRAKVEHEWHDVTRVKEWDDGWYIGYVHDHRDLATLGKLMGHCSGCHFVWAIEERIWYFFAVFDPDGIPHSTIHAKQATWVDKRHPRDDAEPIPENARTWGVLYPSLTEVKDCFQKVGLEYEAGKYAPPRYESCTYDKFRHEGDYQRGTFAYDYGNAQVCATKPADVDEEIWAAYVKAAKAVTDNYNRNKGAIKVVNRRFKFDGKWLLVLSASNKSQQSVNGTHGKRIAEWLNSSGKEKK